MDVDEASLAQKYTLIKLNVTGSTQISKATGTIVSKVTTPSENEKPVIAILTAKARYANKLISIVEISKREAAANNAKYFQYNALSSEMTEVVRDANNVEQDEGDESDQAFETMGAPNLGSTKKRAVPVMRTYLCVTSVRELKTAYG